jgi:hypothetical protein
MVRADTIRKVRALGKALDHFVGVPKCSCAYGPQADYPEHGEGEGVSP